ncbi:aldo/keto reductase [Pseudaquabacterium pictum]|uniref:Oxidoreductase n=1 Tax=Pseudaquabacterium pictum TaxID=2315236 RepID=A0A480AK46_9BURK|nr:aldo/keto reductase [Rubrivivax pictus]GCL61090.1 oxidoreductase [Rubrivivax pictus]
MPAAALPNPAGLSPVIAGAWRLAEWQWTAEQRLAWIEANLDIGVTSFDHADADGSHSVARLLGEALALRPGLRQRVQLVGTCHLGAAATAAADLRAAVDAMLRALQTDHLDLLLIQPAATLPDPDLLAAAVAGLRQAGKLRHAGLANATAPQVAALHARLPLATHQVALSPLQRRALDDGLLDQCLQLGLRPMLWAPLAGGRIFTGQDADACRLRAVLATQAAALGIAVTTLVIAWLLHHPSRPLPILGSRRIVVAQQALAALPLQLEAATWWQIWSAASGQAVP